MIRKSLFIMSVLLLSTVQVESIQIGEEYGNNQLHHEQVLNKIVNNILDKFPQGNTIIHQIVTNISNMNEETLYYLSNVLDKLPEAEKTPEILLNISSMDKNTLQNLNNNF